MHHSKSSPQNLTCHSVTCLVLLLTSWLSGGCGGADRYGPFARVRGTVTYRGQPVSEGSVSFFNSERNIAASGVLSADGSYTLLFGGKQNIPVGKYVVTVVPPAADFEPGEAPPPPTNIENIPRKYQSRETTDLSVEVRDTGEEFDFELGG